MYIFMSDPRQMYNKATSNNIKLITKNIPRQRRPSCVYVYLPWLGTGSLASSKKQRSFHRHTHSSLDGLLWKVIERVCERYLIKGTGPWGEEEVQKVRGRRATIRQTPGARYADWTP